MLHGNTGALAPGLEQHGHVPAGLDQPEIRQRIDEEPPLRRIFIVRPFRDVKGSAMSLRSAARPSSSKVP